ncbi:MAG TPA: hypothetical protein VMU84_19750 [Thermoanaerobaculia bacterium]|nr:hypothetical protein [Thermoanaerobaculia bacterium]
MSVYFLALLLLTADETSTAPPPSQKDTTALVEAAKDAKAKRKKSTTKVITNADVKKAKGKLVQLPGEPEKPRPADTSSPIAKFEAEKKAKVAADARIAVAEARVKDLELELAKIEQAYFDEGDPNMRDTVIRRRFDATQALLEQARRDLEEIRGQ